MWFKWLILAHVINYARPFSTLYQAVRLAGWPAERETWHALHLLCVVCLSFCCTKACIHYAPSRRRKICFNVVAVEQRLASKSVALWVFWENWESLVYLHIHWVNKTSGDKSPGTAKSQAKQTRSAKIFTPFCCASACAHSANAYDGKVIHIILWDDAVLRSVSLSAAAPTTGDSRNFHVLYWGFSCKVLTLKQKAGRTVRV